MTKRLPLLLVSALASGCVSAQSFRSGSGQVYAPTRAESVLIFHSEEDVKRPYEIIAEINTEASSGWGHGEGSLIKKARKEAAKLGAHAILVRPFDAPNNTKKVLAAVFGTNDNKQRMTAIRFTNPPATAPAAGDASPPVMPLTGSAPAPMTNEDVVKLVSGGVGDDVIVTKIGASRTAFVLDADSILRLKAAGASDRVLAAMLEGSK